MLKSLYINNYLLIDKLNVQFANGFTVITGETGAGKSIILGALSLVFGQRADSKLIRPATGKCIIEAVFDITNNPEIKNFFELNQLDYEDSSCIVRREITINGKSRSFVNDTPVALNMLRDLSGMLIDIHSQHENLLLMHQYFQLGVTDAVAAHGQLLTTYQKEYEKWKVLKARLAALQAENDRQKAELDYFEFQHRQLSEAQLSCEEFRELQEEFSIQSHAAEILSALEKSASLLDGDRQILSLLKENNSNIGNIETYLTAAAEWRARFDAVYIELKDVFFEITGYTDKIDFRPQRLEEINNRLNEIYALQNKFRVNTVDELIKLRDEFAAKIEQTEAGTERIDELKVEIEEYNKLLTGLAAELTHNRKVACNLVENHVVEQMKSLGVPNIRFEVRMTAREQLTDSGADEVQFYFSANKNRDLQAVQSVASGGEISRIMLSLKSLVAGKSELPAIIFDEIDMGVSGEIAHRMAQIMSEMSREMQVITITHLPQIAAKGKQHIKVYKDETGLEARTCMTQLTIDQRITEIAQMLSGHTVSEAALANAAELLGV